MGATALAGMLEVADQDTVLSWHLTNNLYPPLNGPADMVMAKRAIALGNEGKFGEAVEVKLGDCDIEEIERRKGSPLTEDELAKPIFLQNGSGRKVTAGEIVEAWHLDDFLTEG